MNASSIITNSFLTTGLSDNEVKESKNSFGNNVITAKVRCPLVEIVVDVFKEPMVIILLVISTIYLVTGNSGDAIMLGVAIVFISFISAIQKSKSNKALQALRQLGQPKCKVIRASNEIMIPKEDVVVGDLMVVEEGSALPADGLLLRSNDFSVNEAILTGESLPVFKSVALDGTEVYQGTLVTSGLGMARVTRIGGRTKLAEIGALMENVKESASPLELEIRAAVKKMIVVGTVIFLGVWLLNYLNGEDFLQSLIFALTIAMSILPEEIPVAYSTFLALGSRRLIKKGVLVKNVKTLEALGDTTVICSDKTGTITQNKMSIASCYSLRGNRAAHPDKDMTAFKDLIWLARLASEPKAFDPMELAIIKLYEEVFDDEDYNRLEFIYEYPLSGTPPLMTHIYKNATGEIIIACKGAPEAIINLSKLSNKDQELVEEQLESYTSKGYRVLAVGESTYEGGDFPKDQSSFLFSFRGLVAFYDPPKAGIGQVFSKIEDAGIEIKIITGDNEKTTAAIAKQIDFNGHESVVNGQAMLHLSTELLDKLVEDNKIFTRMFPEAKLRLVESMKSKGEIVSMIGDGVNDAPALKSAHIGIAMGKKGSEVAKEASDLILVNDDFSSLLPALAMGRRIHENLKKAIGYIITIHIPIVLIVFLPLALGWIYPQIFKPIHVILLELIMGPTCSIVYENEPVESRIMEKEYWSKRRPLFNPKDLTAAIIQGIAITLGLLITYRIAIVDGLDEATTRTMIFVTIIIANLVLTLVNRSTIDSVFDSMKKKNNLVWIMLSLVILLQIIIVVVPEIRDLFDFASLGFNQTVVSVAVGLSSVAWYELVKWHRRILLATR